MEVPAETRAEKGALHALLHGAGGGHVLRKRATHSPPPSAGLLSTPRPREALSTPLPSHRTGTG